MRILEIPADSWSYKRIEPWVLHGSHETPLRRQQLLHTTAMSGTSAELEVRYARRTQILRIVAESSSAFDRSP